MNRRNQFGTGNSRSRGFSTLELLLVMVVSLVIAALSIPGFNQVRRTLRISGDVRDLNGAINQAKLQAAADFTRARVRINTNTNTFQIETWGQVNNCWQTIGEADAAGRRRCTVDGVSPVQNLSPGVTFGTGGIAGAPPNTQAQLQEGLGATCRQGLNWTGTPIQNSACITFSSRGVPVDPKQNGAPTGQGGVYITDNTQVYGVTIAATGMSQVWATSVHGTGAGYWYHK